MAAATIVVDQMGHFQEATDATRAPLILIHGGCLTWKTWETTPNGRIGWDEFFVHEPSQHMYRSDLARTLSGRAIRHLAGDSKPMHACATLATVLSAMDVAPLQMQSE